MKCSDIKFGTYDCAYNIMPPWTYKYIAIDKCLMKEILELWECGIKTTGCCCGHGDEKMQFIGVEKEYTQRMLDMGYFEKYNPHDPDSHTTFYPINWIHYYEDFDIPYKFNWWDIYGKEEIKGELK